MNDLKDILPHNYQQEVKKYFRPKVRSGIKFLDDYSPFWRKNIQKEYLKMQHCDACILGQIFGNFFEALQDFIAEEITLGWDNSDKFAAEHGFYLHDTKELTVISEGYDLWEGFDCEEINDSWWFFLGETWIEELNKRNGK